MKNTTLNSKSILILVFLAFFSIDAMSKTNRPAISQFATTAQEIEKQKGIYKKPVMKFSDKTVIQSFKPGLFNIFGSSLKGLTIASADFNKDGVSDLVSLQNTSLSVQFGNIDSLHPNADDARARKANGTFTGLPFLPNQNNKTVSLTSNEVFIGAGDFDADDCNDVVIVEKGSNIIRFLRGDGKGNFADAEKIEIAGKATSFAVGEVNRYDGLPDFAIGVETDKGGKVLVFESPRGAMRGTPEAIEVGETPNSIAIGQLDKDFPFDIAVANGSEVKIIWGRDRKLSLDPELRASVLPAKEKNIKFDAKIKSVAIGTFDGDNEYDALAVLDETGKIMIMPNQETAERKEWNLPATSLSKLPEITISAARISSSPREQVLINDNTAKNIQVLTLSRDGERRFIEAQEISVNEETSAIIPMRLNVDALDDLVMYSAKNSEVSTLLTAPNQVFTVTNTNDSGAGSFRQAVLDANSNLGLDSINFAISGNGIKTINLISKILIAEPTVIDGTTQTGFTQETPTVVLRDMGLISLGLDLIAGNCTIKGIKFSSFDVGTDLDKPLRITINGNNTITTNIFGSTTIGSDGNEVGLEVFSNNNIIGGTTNLDTNVISKNRYGLYVAAFGSNLIQNNHVISNDKLLLGGGQYPIGILVTNAEDCICDIDTRQNLNIIPCVQLKIY
jgi:hypothetical protein